MLPLRTKPSVSPETVVLMAGTWRDCPTGAGGHGSVLPEGLAVTASRGDGEELGEGLAAPGMHAGSPRSRPPSTNCARPRKFNLNC
jgi:hypothetical protein